MLPNRVEFPLSETMNMAQNAPDMFHDAQRLLKIERWARRFAWLAFIFFLLNLLGLGMTLVNVFFDSEAFAGLESLDNIWFKSNVVIMGFRAILGSAAAYFLLQGLSKIIRYLLNLKNLALKRYQSRKSLRPL